MDIQKLIQEQFIAVDRWTLNLIESVPGHFWKVHIPAIQTNLNWQVGHILVSKYFHALACINGPLVELNQSLPISEYMSMYNVGSISDDQMELKPDKERLLYDLNIINQLASKRLEEISSTEIMQRTELPNPVAETKYEALMWTFKHQMWHNGQIAIIKKALTENSMP